MDILALFSNYTFQIVALGSALLGIISGVLGSFAVLRKQSLLGDGVSHAALPGVVLVFLLTGSKNTEMLLLGALVTGIFATLLILGIVKTTRVKFDAALALVLSVFFGLGTVLLTYSQKIPNANQAGLKNYIYGQAANMLESDVLSMLVVGFIVIILVLLFWKELKITSFDPEYAKTLGFNTSYINLLMILLLVLAIIIGLQTVGVILMSALIIAPAVSARQWTNKFSIMVILAAIFGGLSGLLGATISITSSKLATGPIIVVVATIIAITSLLIAPKRGVISKLYKRNQNKKRYLDKDGDLDHVC